MKKITLISAIICCLCLTDSMGQEKESLKLLEKGNNYYNKDKHEKAQKYYARALKADSNNLKASLYYGIGLLESKEKWKALSYIEKAYRVDPGINDQIELYMGMAYHYNGDFHKALHHFKIAQATLRKYNKAEKEEINIRLRQCQYAIKLEEERTDYLVMNLGPGVNSAFSEYAPIVDAQQEKLLFASNRINKKKQKEFFTDIYSFDKKDNSDKDANKIKSTLNTKYDDVILDISDDGTQMLLHSYKNNGDIYISYLQEGQWSKPVSIGVDINTENFVEGNACFSADGKAIFFASDRPGGYGGFDLYTSQKEVNGRWTKPSNLGSNVNTKGNEDAPSVSPDGKMLFFSSEEHQGIGGYDVFYSMAEEPKNTWSTPVNMGLSVNTPEDDINFVVSNDGTYAYFSSTRKDSYGAEDLYQVMLPAEREENLLASIYKGSSKTNKEEINNSQVVSNNHMILTSNSKPKPYFAEEKILRNIYFQIDEEQLTDESKQHLDHIASYLKANKEIKIEVAGHTDDTGTEAYNYVLSEKRAENVYAYLVANDVSPDRLSLKAHGNTVPLATNDDEREGRELNRRVELNIISDFEPFKILPGIMVTSSK